MKTLVLYGELAETFGPSFTMDVSTPQDALRLMDSNYPGEFRSRLKNKHFELVLGNRVVPKDHLFMGCSENEIHLRPVLMGAGAILPLAFTFAIPLLETALGIEALGLTGQLLFGVATIGVAALLSNLIKPTNPSSRETNQKPSFVFDGPVNTVEQGGPVPLVYGRIRAGSVVISSGLTIQKIL